MPADPNAHSSIPRPSSRNARRPSNIHSSARNPAAASRYRIAVRWNGSTRTIAESAIGNIAPQPKAGTRLGRYFDDPRNDGRDR